MNGPKFYVKKPIPVPAILWTGDNLKAVLDFGAPFVHEEGTELHILTPAGMVKAVIGHWILKANENDVYPCPPELFEASYAEVVGQ